MFEKAKLAKVLQEEVNELREKADELVTTTKELEALQETHAMVRIHFCIIHIYYLLLLRTTYMHANDEYTHCFDFN